MKHFFNERKFFQEYLGWTEDTIGKNFPKQRDYSDEFNEQSGVRVRQKEIGDISQDIMTTNATNIDALKKSLNFSWINAMLDTATGKSEREYLKAFEAGPTSESISLFKHLEFSKEEMDFFSRKTTKAEW